MIIYSSSGIIVLFKSRGGRSVPGLGTIANSVAIIVGAVLGVFCKRGIKKTTFVGGHFIGADRETKIFFKNFLLG